MRIARIYGSTTVFVSRPSARDQYRPMACVARTTDSRHAGDWDLDHAVPPMGIAAMEQPIAPPTSVSPVPAALVVVSVQTELVVRLLAVPVLALVHVAVRADTAAVVRTGVA
jgi:hypothetical protein